jgi:hypothetical protein
MRGGVPVGARKNDWEGDMKNWLALVSVGVVAGFAAAAVADDDHDHDRGSRNKRVFRAQLVGLSEVPSVSTQARGEFYAVVNKEGTAFTYWLTFSGLTGAVSQSHIHIGQHHTNGGVSVWLCQGTLPAPDSVKEQVPPCGATATTKPITGTIDATDVIGPAGQGVAAAEFAELLAAMRAGAAYANVHSTTFGPGEIRGQID